MGNEGFELDSQRVEQDEQPGTDLSEIVGRRKSGIYTIGHGSP